MKHLKTSVAAWSALGAVVSFLLLNQVLSYDSMVEVSSALVLGVSLAILIRWSRDAARSMRAGREGSDFLIVGVFSMVLVVFFQRVWVIVVRAYDRADFLVYSPVGAFIAWMLAWACTLILVAPDAEDGAIPPRSRLLIGFALFTAGLVSGVSIMAFLS